MEMGRATLMASGKFGSFAMDNSQFKVLRKYQREGVSSAMAMFTSRFGFKVIPHQGREGTEGEFKFQNENNVRAMFNSRIPSMLDKNRRPQNGEEYSYYKWIGEFPHRATVR